MQERNTGESTAIPDDGISMADAAAILREQTADQREKEAKKRA